MTFLTIAMQTFRSYQTLGEKALGQVPDDRLTWEPTPGVNSLAVIVQHLAGNMLSRWTDFLTSDGEKDWRNRDREFEPDLKSRDELLSCWTEGWDCLFTTLQSLTEADLQRTILIRAEPHTVEQAIVRQLAHYAYHIGQMVYVARIIRGEAWQSLSIPRGESEAFNQRKMGRAEDAS
ncbi:MAG: DUF1572 family protein [Saprospiraceae bacterium]